jgi:predicted DNA-binding antitoxin AbrB/MazE fold protein
VNEDENFALVLKPLAAINKAEPGIKRRIAAQAEKLADEIKGLNGEISSKIG